MTSGLKEGLEYMKSEEGKQGNISPLKVRTCLIPLLTCRTWLLLSNFSLLLHSVCWVLNECTTIFQAALSLGPSAFAEGWHNLLQCSMIRNCQGKQDCISLSEKVAEASERKSYWSWAFKNEQGLSKQRNACIVWSRRGGEGRAFSPSVWRMHSNSVRPE